MLRVGLTGGIGSGKSTVARIFEALGIPVYYADAEARRIMNTDTALRQKITAAFGEEAYINNELNSSFISSVVFNDAEKLDLLNSLVHPATMNDGEKWMNELAASGKKNADYAIHEAALIFEAGVAERLDAVIGVSAPETLRIQRTMQRGKLTREQVLQRMNRQIEEEVKMKLCDYIIINDEQKPVIPQVLNLHKLLLQKAWDQQ